MQWSGSNKMISRILILNVFDYQFANCLRPNLTFIWGLVGYLEVSKILLAKQVEKNLIENRGFSPLHWASRNGHSKVCKILIENQAEKNVINTIGWTLLHWASCSRHSEVCKKLYLKAKWKKIQMFSSKYILLHFFGTFRSLLVSKCNQNPLKNLLHVLF